MRRGVDPRATARARVEREQRAARRGGREAITVSVVTPRSIANADQRAQWTSEEAIAAAEKYEIVRAADRARHDDA